MADTPKSFLNDVKKIVNRNNNREMLYARKAGTTDLNGIYWRRDRVVTIKTSYLNEAKKAIKSVTFTRTTNEDHISDSNNVNNEIENLNWSDTQILKGDDLHKCAFYRKNVENNDREGKVEILITLKDSSENEDHIGYYHRKQSFSNDYFEETDWSDPVEITEITGPLPIYYRTVKLTLKSGVTIPDDLILDFNVSPFTSVSIKTEDIVDNASSGVFVSGSIKDGWDNILKTFYYEFVNSYRDNKILLNFGGYIKVDLHIYSSMYGDKIVLNNKISNTSLNKNDDDYMEHFGIISTFVPVSSEGLTISSEDIPASYQYYYYFAKGFKEISITSTNADRHWVDLKVKTSPVYVCKLKNNLKWATDDKDEVCSYKISTNTTDWADVSSWSSLNNSYIYHTSKLNGKENGKPYIVLRVNNPTTDGVDAGIDTSIDTDSYDYYNIINGTSKTSSQYMELYNNSKYQMFLATFEDYTKSSEAKIERKFYKINFILNKNGFTFDYFNWDSTSIDVKYGDKVEYEIQKDSGTSENRFITSTDDTKDVFFKIKVTKWFDYSQERSSNIFMIKSYNTSSNNLGDFELTNSLTLDSDNLIIGTGSLTMKALDYAHAKIVRLKYTYESISEIRLTPYSTNPSFPSNAEEITRFNRRSGNKVSTSGTQITYLAPVGTDEHKTCCIWIKSKSNAEDGVTRWAYFSKKFFYINDLFTRDIKVDDLPATNIPCIITNNNVKELWFLAYFGGGSTEKNIVPPVMCDENVSGAKSYEPIDLYINLEKFAYTNIRDGQNYRFKVEITSGSPILIDIGNLGSKSTSGNKSLFCSNVYWSCDQTAGDSSVCNYKYKYYNDTNTNLGYYQSFLNSSDPLFNKTFEYQRYHNLLRNWGNVESNGLKKDSSIISDVYRGPSYITLSLAVVLPEDTPEGYLPGNNFLTNGFTKVYAGSIFDKTKSSASYEECYLFIANPDNTSAIYNNLDKTTFKGSSNPKFAQSNALLFEFCPIKYITI